jgi:alkylhydroperoxidase family enzyme
LIGSTPRIPYADPDDPQLKPLADRIVAERGEVLDLYRMTRHIQVDEDVWNQVRTFGTDREVVELVGTIASYNMVSRFLEALEIRA